MVETPKHLLMLRLGASYVARGITLHAYLALTKVRLYMFARLQPARALLLGRDAY
jgi:hypothetical protein